MDIDATLRLHTGNLLFGVNKKELVILMDHRFGTVIGNYFAGTDEIFK